MTLAVCATMHGAACGDPDRIGLDDFLPEVPAPTGESRAVWAGAITADNPDELVDGPSRSGMIGDFFMRNSRVHLVIQAPARTVGVIPQGGNLVDAVPLGPDGQPSAEDHFGEVAPTYVLGRTCDHKAVDIVSDGSGGGAAVVRARGVSAANDMLNIRGLGVFNVVPSLDPDIDDGVECATTYVLQPDDNAVRIYWTFYNPNTRAIRGPFSVLGDGGGEVAPWAPERGFSWAEATDAFTDTPPPIPYELYQGPGVAYGFLPRHEDPDQGNASFILGGRSGLLFGVANIFRALTLDAPFFELPAEGGVTHAMDIVVDRDAAAVDAVFRASHGLALVALAGTVSWDDGTQAAGARVGVYRDLAGDGVIDADDAIVSYIDALDDGRFSGQVPQAAGYLLRADITELARSATVAVSAQADAGDLALTLPTPVRFDFSIVDDDTGALVPGRIIVLGRHPVAPDHRFTPTHDTRFGVVRTILATRGTTVDVGDGVDPPLLLPAGASYRIMVSRGTEWSVADQLITVAPGDPGTELEFRVRRVAAATGYLSSEYHVHQLRSYDAHIGNQARVDSMVADGVELFAATDHDVVTNLQPLVEAAGLTRLTRAMVGLEVTTEGYGHFNGFPLAYDELSPDHGAVDWARGTEGYAMIPGEIFADLRARGAQVSQINHPRIPLGDTYDYIRFFDRAGLRYDYDARQIVGDIALSAVPNSWLRLPETSLWDDSFNALEVWNGFFVADTDNDGVREITPLDSILRDYFNFLSLGFEVTPTANSDTHKVVTAPSGMPRTYVRVTDDSPDALLSGTAVADALATIAGVVPRDVVLTNGPHVQVRLAGSQESAIGRVIDAGGGSVTLDVDVVAPAWAKIDTLELFANATPEIDTEVTVLQPLMCFTSRDPGSLADNDVCATALGGPRPLTVTLETVAPGFERYTASLQITVDAADIVNRAGAMGDDAWLVVRARGSRAIFPVLLDGLLREDTLDVLVSGAPAAQDDILDADGVPAYGMTSPVFVDFDGNGYRAIFQP